MSDLVLALGWFGIYAPMAIGAVGSAIGCAIAGQAGIGAMLETGSPSSWPGSASMKRTKGS